MKNKILKALLTVVLFLSVGTSVYAKDDDEPIIVSITDLTSNYVKADGSGDLTQELNADGSGFTPIILEPVGVGHAFSTDTSSILNGDNGLLKDTNLVADFDFSTMKLRIRLDSGKTTVAKSVTVSASSILTNTYVLYSGNSVLGEQDASNPMHVQYDVSTHKLTFDSLPYSDEYNILEYINTSASPETKTYVNEFTRFWCFVYKGTSTEKTGTALLNFNVGSGTKNPASGIKADTKYTFGVDDAANPAIDLEAVLNELGDNISDTDHLWIEAVACGGYSLQKSFFIDAGLVSAIKGSTTSRKVEIDICDGVKLAEGSSGGLVQNLDDFTSFKHIALNTIPGYSFTDETLDNLKATLEPKGLTAEMDDDKNIMTIYPTGTSAAIQEVTASIDASTLTKKYVMYSGVSDASKTGNENEMNAKYDNSTGKLTFNCDRTGTLEYQIDGKRIDYISFTRFYVTVYTSNEGGSIDEGTKLKEFNLGDGSGVKADTDYASSSTINPYINLKKFIKENGKNLKSTDLIWVKVRACGPSMLGDGNVFFKIRVGTVEDILKEPSSDSSSKKSSGGWDDGGPFTTDTCGNVFDRWGNKIYEAKGCNVGGYNLVRTSVED